MPLDFENVLRSCSVKYAVLIGALIAIIHSHLSWAQQSMQFELPLIVNRAVSGDISSTIIITTIGGEEQTAVTLPAGRLRSLLSSHANEEQLQSWLSDDDDDTQLSTKLLRERGLDIHFDSGLLELNALVPRLGTQNVSIRGRKKPLLENHYQQSSFASGLTYRIRNQYNHKASRGSKQGFKGLQADISGFTSVGGFGGWSLTISDLARYVGYQH